MKKGDAFQARAAGPAGPSQQAVSAIGSIPIAAACHALCQSGKFETGQGGCAAICMSMLGSSRGGPHGCDYAVRVHEVLARAVLEAAAKSETQP